MPAWLSVSQPHLAVQEMARRVSESTGSSTVCHSNRLSNTLRRLTSMPAEEPGFCLVTKPHRTSSSLAHPFLSMHCLAPGQYHWQQQQHPPRWWNAFPKTCCVILCILQLLAVVSSM